MSNSDVQDFLLTQNSSTSSSPSSLEEFDVMNQNHLDLDALESREASLGSSKLDVVSRPMDISSHEVEDCDDLHNQGELGLNIDEFFAF